MYVAVAVAVAVACNSSSDSTSSLRTSIWHGFGPKKTKKKKKKKKKFLMGLAVKDPALFLLWLWSLLWFGFDPWPKNFCMPQCGQKQTNKQKQKTKV